MSHRRRPGEQPTDDAYGRVTDPGRFQRVVEAAERLVTEVVSAYDVEAQPVALGRCLWAVRLAPEGGAPLVVGVSDPAAVWLQVGTVPTEARLPDCGCDACDEDPDELVELLRQRVACVVDGALVERLRPDGLEVVWGPHGCSLVHVLDGHGYAAAVRAGVPAERRWSAWAMRAAPVGPAT